MYLACRCVYRRVYAAHIDTHAGASGRACRREWMRTAARGYAWLRARPLATAHGSPCYSFKMTDRLTSLLAERPWLLADGATGSNLFDRGLQSGDAPELWNSEHPERVAQLH